MWHKEYRDYKPHDRLIKQQVATGKGLKGCEMHELNSWGEDYHHPPAKQRHGIFSTLLRALSTKIKSKTSGSQ